MTAILRSFPADVGDPGEASPGLLISMQGVSKRYSNGKLAIDKVDLLVRESEFLSLVGPSGCGKSTLLRLIAGLNQPSSGSIDRTAALSGSRSSLDSIGFVFQEPTLMPWATALRNVMLPLTLRGVARLEARERAAEMLEQVGLTGFERTYPRELSGGMKMRVSIARALVTRPRLLLMDEPFGALDEITRQKLNDDLLGLWGRSRFTAVFVTHSVFESVYLSRRIVIMAARPGRVVSDLAINAAIPRDKTFRTSGEYARWCRTVSDKLSEAISS